MYIQLVYIYACAQALRDLIKVFFDNAGVCYVKLEVNLRSPCTNGLEKILHVISDSLLWLVGGKLETFAFQSCESL